MAKYLVIVESPAKAKTIKKFLGKSYKVEASNGHIRDLPKSQLGVNIEEDFEPKYITIRGKGELLRKLRKEAKKADKVFLATDPDREGEAISWHLLHSLNIDPEVTKRITFNEITKNAVKDSIKQAREIDMDLVDAQQARRILDRIVGYKISPLLWKKIKKGLSAGRVQSVALRLICDREEEVQEFIPKEYWSIEADLYPEGNKKAGFEGKFYGTKNKKMELKSKEEVDCILQEIKESSFVVSEVKHGQRLKRSQPPFTTSTLQQVASKNLNFSTQKTMRIAQQLYEGVDIQGVGTVGLITYLRTDSTRISQEAHGQALTYIKNQFGEAYADENSNQYAKRKNAQDAHEAIRPANVELSPKEIKDSLSRDQFRLYQLIWNRFLASRMTEAKYRTYSLKIDAGKYRFTSSSSDLIFDGFLKVYNVEQEQTEKNNIGEIKKGDVLNLKDIAGNQHFTQPPPRYTEASLVKTLEQNGVGRPSTYAPTISTLTYRFYITKENKVLYPTELGTIVNEIMKNYFEEIVNVDFTAQLEEQLDHVEEGNMPWKKVIRDFYPEFYDSVKKAEEKIGNIEIKDEETDIKCEKCGRNMVVKIGRHGKFLACPGFPECRNAKPYYEETGVDCPKCKGKILIKKTKKGRIFYGCENNPECDFMTWNKPTNQKCPRCGDILLEKGTKKKKYVCNNQECGYIIDDIDE